MGLANPNPDPDPKPNPNPNPNQVLQMFGGWAWMQSCFNSTMSLGQVAAVILFWGGLMLPLSLVDKMSALQCTSLFGVISLFYLVLSVMVHAAWASVAEPLPASEPIKLWSPSLSTFPALSIIMFAFTCQVNVPALYEELQPRSPAKMRS